MLMLFFGLEGDVQLTPSDCVTGAVRPHAASGLDTQTDVEAFKAAMQECTQQAQNLLVSCCALLAES